VVVPQKTGKAVPRRGRMRDFGESGSPANLVVLKSGERSSASLGGRARKTVDSLSSTVLEVEKGLAVRKCHGKSSHGRYILTTQWGWGTEIDIAISQGGGCKNLERGTAKILMEGSR
jgi:hypothetical protein